MRVACVILQKSLIPFAEACLRLSPQIMLGENWIFIEIGACRKLYSEDFFLKKLQVLLKRFGVVGKVAVADDIPTALGHAFYRKQKLPIEALTFYASPLKMKEEMSSVIDTLKSLGIHTLEDFKKLPIKSLGNRFGRDAVTAFYHLENAKGILWNRFSLTEKIEESESIDESYELREFEPVSFLLRGMIDRILLRLRGRGQLVSILEFTIEQESYSTIKEPVRSWKFEFLFPQGSVFGVFPLLRERISSELQRKPLESPIRNLKLEIVKTSESFCRQTDFFSKKEETEENFRALLVKLSDRLGLEKIFYASPQESYIPERSWQKTLVEPQPIFIPLPERPLRLLKNPQKLNQVDSYLIHHKRKWKMVECEGPERISGEWWKFDEERDYFKILTDSGEELWVYVIPGQKELYLHGVFD